MSDEQAPDQTPESLPPSARRTLEDFVAAGWPTPGVPDWTTGGYATKERLLELAFLLADYVDQATGHPDATQPTQDASDAPERASA